MMQERSIDPEMTEPLNFRLRNLNSTLHAAESDMVGAEPQEVDWKLRDWRKENKQLRDYVSGPGEKGLQ